MKHSKIFIPLIFLYLIAGIAIAQDSLSIERAIEIGLENNFQIRVAEKRVDIAKNNNSWASAGAFPTISLNAISSLNHSNDVSNAPVGTNTIQTGILQPSIDLNWILFNGFRIRTTHARLNDLQLQTEGNAAITVENSLQSIILAYYLAKLNEETLSLTQEILDLSRDRYKYMQVKKGFGNALTFDVLQAKNNYLTDSANVLRQRLNYENSIRNLNLILAEPSDRNYYLSSDFNINSYNQDFQLSDLKTKMEGSNKTLQNQYIYQALLKKNIKLNQSQLYPMVSLSAGTNLNNTGIYFNGDNGKWSDSYGANARLTLSWTLSNGGNIRSAIQNARIEEEIGQLQTEELQRTMSNLLFRVYEEYTIKRQLLQVAELSVESAKLNLQIAEDKFKSGSINSFNYRDIQIIYLNAASGLIQSSFNLIDSYTELLRLTGGIISDFSEEKVIN